jgi:hypothetical protein
MKRATRFYFFNLRLLIGLLVLFAGAILGLFAKANPKALTQGTARYLRPFPGGGVQEAALLTPAELPPPHSLPARSRYRLLFTGTAKNAVLTLVIGSIALPVISPSSLMSLACSSRAG